MLSHQRKACLAAFAVFSVLPETGPMLALPFVPEGLQGVEAAFEDALRLGRRAKPGRRHQRFE